MNATATYATLREWLTTDAARDALNATAKTGEPVILAITTWRAAVEWAASVADAHAAKCRCDAVGESLHGPLAMHGRADGASDLADMLRNGGALPVPPAPF